MTWILLIFTQYGITTAEFNTYDACRHAATVMSELAYHATSAYATCVEKG